MRISIITATYNSEKTISDTLLSLEQQTYQDVEFIIIDGGSKDNTLDVIKEKSTRVTKVISEPDKGIYDALNKGIHHATGDVIGFLHSDDLFAYDGALQDVAYTFFSNQCDAVYGDLEYVSHGDINERVRLWVSGEISRKKLLKGWMPPHPSFYMKRDQYLIFGGFSMDYKISSDYDSMLRYLLIGGVQAKYIPHVLVKMRVGGISNRSLSSIINKSFEDISVMRKNGLFWPFALAYKNLSKISQFIKK